MTDEERRALDAKVAAAAEVLGLLLVPGAYVLVAVQATGPGNFATPWRSNVRLAALPELLRHVATSVEKQAATTAGGIILPPRGGLHS